MTRCPYKLIINDEKDITKKIYLCKYFIYKIPCNDCIYNFLDFYKN